MAGLLFLFWAVSFLVCCPFLVLLILSFPCWDSLCEKGSLKRRAASSTQSSRFSLLSFAQSSPCLALLSSIRCRLAALSPVPLSSPCPPACPLHYLELRLPAATCLVRRQHGSANTSTTNAPIKNQTKGSDSLRCNISSANRIKKINWFCIAGCENHRGRNHQPSIARGGF